MADFGRIETCACCGKDVKRLVKFRGAYVGKNCWEALSFFRQTTILAGREKATEEAKRYYPRSWERIAAMAG